MAFINCFSIFLILFIRFVTSQEIDSATCQSYLENPYNSKVTLKNRELNICVPKECGYLARLELKNATISYESVEKNVTSCCHDGCIENDIQVEQGSLTYKNFVIEGHLDAVLGKDNECPRLYRDDIKLIFEDLVILIDGCLHPCGNCYCPNVKLSATVKDVEAEVCKHTKCIVRDQIEEVLYNMLKGCSDNLLREILKEMICYSRCGAC